LLLTLFVLFSSSTFAAKNPISWQVDQAFPNPVLTGGSYVVTYTFTNQLPLQLVNPLVIQKTVSPANEFSFVDTCTGQRLTPQQSCTVQVRLDPLAVGQKTLQLVITGYDRNSVPVPAVSTAVQAQVVANILATTTVPLPSTFAVGQPEGYTFTFKNKGSSAATGVSVQSSSPGFTTTCTTQLTAGNSCTVSGVYTAQTATPSVQTVTATFSYAEGSSVVASASATISAATGVIGSVVSPNFLPAVMVGGAPAKTLQFLFTNYNSTPVTVTSNSVLITGGAGATFTPGTNPGDNSCTAATVLNTGAACQILGTFLAPVEVAPTGFAVTASLVYTGAIGSPSVVSTATTVVAALSTDRIVTFVNQCPFSVWFSLNGGSLANSPTCASNADCPTGTSCNTGSKICYWNNYAPANSTYQLAGSGGTNSVTIPLTTADPTIQWSGNISASTSCHGATCDQASCQNNGGTTSCAPGIGFTQPATQAEITMLTASVDSYDVEVINGFHIPIQMAPGPFVTPNNYSCGTPGSFTAGNGFGACNWSNAVTPSSPYNWVTAGGAACGSGLPACGGGQLCGLDSGLNQVCGSFLGFWTGDQACGVNAAKAQPYFGCTNPLGSPFAGNSTLQQLMSCSVPKGDLTPRFNSCYLSYPGYNALAISQCCGCVDWWSVGGVGANPNTQSCTQAGQASPQSDPQWTSNIQQTIQWLKKACPSVYTYPFDDKTSGFSCSNNLPSSPNSVGYTVTFCAGNSGLPSGILEGR
jgi:hypothetical protein